MNGMNGMNGMKRLMATGLLLGVAIVAGQGCGNGPTLESEVQDFIEQRDLTVKDCGDIEVASPCDALETWDAQTCFAEGIAACQTVRVDVTMYTIEGDPIYATYLVVPEGDSCFVEEFLDNREDKFGDGELRKSYCEQATTGDGCSPIIAGQCISECGSNSDCG